MASKTSWTRLTTSSFTQLPTLTCKAELVIELVEFFERDIVEPTHYSLDRLDQQVTFLVTMISSRPISLDRLSLVGIINR